MLKHQLLWLLHFIGIIIFMNGFFQMKSNLQGFADKKDFPTEPSSTESIPYTFTLKHIVLIVIDALRTDFLTNEKSKTNFPYVKKILKDKKAILFNAKAHHPTVTLPRIKAITSGGIPGFIDILYNFNSPELTEDNIVTQSILNGKNIIFYGDDTWLKLFPNHFKRSEGTTSFYVSDYIQVDKNVTRNIKEELKLFDWNLQILHYLGLDHIGHLQGPFSRLVTPKLQEMDEIIKYIHKELEKRDDKSMIIVCGDHGMSDGGNHGGASKEETSIPLLFIHNQKRFLKQNIININQISITPTLSVLLNLPIPKNNLGTVLIDVLIDLNTREKLYALLYNYNQLKLKGDFSLNQTLMEMHRKWLNKNTPFDEAKDEIEAYNAVIDRLSSELSMDLTKQDLNIVLIGFFIVSMVFVIVLLIQFNILFKSFESLIDKFNILTWILHSLSLFSSSFIEEEHLLLYFYTSTLHLLFLIDNLSKKNIQNCKIVILSWICTRLMRNWNQTGDKWAYLPDINKWINRPENQFYLFISLFSALFLLLFIRFRQTKPNIRTLYLLYSGFAFIFIHKSLQLINSKHENLIPLFIYINIALIILSDCSITSLISSWVILSCLLMRIHNIALLSLTAVNEYFISRLIPKNKYTIQCIYYALAMTSFFHQGNSNSLSKIDIATGYIGLSDYYPLIVSFLLISHTYSLFIFWILSLIYRTREKSSNFDFLSSISAFICLVRGLPMAITTLSLTIQRNHLFIWSVFAPKLLYESFHSLVTWFMLIFLTCVIKITSIY